jgi:hypothetical protein
VQVHDNGGTANSGVDTSAAQTFTINITPASFSISGTTLTVSGQAGAANVYGLTLATNASSMQVTANGVTNSYSIPTIAKVVFVGGSARDTLSITGSSKAETATFSAGTALLMTHSSTGGDSAYEIDASSMENITIVGGPEDTAIIDAKAGVTNTFSATIDSSNLASYMTDGSPTSGTYFQQATGFGHVYGYVSSSADTAYIYDSTAGTDSAVISQESYASMTTVADGNGYVRYAQESGFQHVYLYSHGGGDTATYYDSADSDTLIFVPNASSASNYSTMSSASSTTGNWLAETIGFVNTTANRTHSSGTDTAYFYPTSGQDQLTLEPTYALEQFYFQVNAYAGTDLEIGFNVVVGEGSASGDSLVIGYQTRSYSYLGYGDWTHS